MAEFFRSLKDVETVLETSRNRSVVIASPAFLAGFALVPGEEIPEEIERMIDDNLLVSLWEEYFDIYDTIVRARGEDHIVVVENELKLPQILPNNQIESQPLPIPEQFISKQQAVNWLESFYCYWPRNAYLEVDGQIFFFPEAWRGIDGLVSLSYLGDGGRVLAKQDAIIVTPTIWNLAGNDLDKMRARGFKVAVIPTVNPVKQKFNFCQRDIDGHSQLIEGSNDQLHLLVARSFFNQGRYQGQDTQKVIESSCRETDVNLVVIDDRRLPPLSLNLLQLDNQAVVFTGPADSTLGKVLKEIVGKDKIFPTQQPIRLIPQKSKGGIGCLTNLLPEQLKAAM